ncbi:putative proton-dependent oligopeptide transporter family [Helianthus anomalus]
MLQQMIVGLIIHSITMIIVCLVERYRLSIAKDHGIYKPRKTVPLRIYILLPQICVDGCW